VIGAAWGTLAALLLSTPASPREELVQVVLVSRHGVRTPTMPADQLAGWAAEPWPTWKEPLGYLTARGKKLAAIVGRYQREALAGEKLLPGASSGCPDRGSVYVYADVAERTEQTAQGFLDGFAPGCGIPVESKAPAKVDGVFHPVAAGVCAIDAFEAQSAILSRLGESGFPSVWDQHREAADALQTMLGCCAPALCAAYGRPSPCTLSQIPTALTSLRGGAGVNLIGGLWIASTASEIFLLEYADGKPPAEVGWGRADAAGIRKVLPLHDRAFDLLFRTPYLARRQGSSLLARVAGALTGRPIGGLPAPDPAVRGARLVAFFGHDDNLANLGGLLGASWSMPGFPKNETPPAGAMVFEKRRSADGTERIYASYVSQSIEQMRDASPLSAESPPTRASIRIPGCSADTPGYPCAVADFEAAVARTLDSDCVDRDDLRPAGLSPGSPGPPSGASWETPWDALARSSPRGR
jgi:4-phytase/acid phosphatase